MQLSKSFEYPEHLEEKFEKAKKIEWITIGYLVSALIGMYLVMSTSQAMKTAWVEDILSLIPPISFLIASKIYTRPPNQDFLYGYHRVISIAFLISAVALCAIGFSLLIDSVIKLLKTEHATISSVMIFGHQVWLGYLMIVVMLYSTIPVMILGRIKHPIAKELFEKNLYTDAVMSKANWLTGVAAIVGIIGIGIGWWWADSVAAIIICIDVLHDGYTNLKEATLDLMNQTPKTVEEKKTDPIFQRIKIEIEKEVWVKEVRVRFRQEGHVYFGEAFIIPVSEDNITDKIEELKKRIIEMNWRIFDVTITLAKKF
jgi:cation diffusion facilitator family transporter